MRALLLPGKILIAIIVAAPIAYAIAASGAPTQGPPDAAERLLQERLGAYVSLRDELARVAELPLEPVDEQTAARQRWRLGIVMRGARRDVPQGNIFGGAVAAYFRRVSAEQSEDVRLWVMARAYEQAAVEPARVTHPFPLGATHDVHGALLDAFPQLPRGIEYRVVHYDLVLWDLHADLVIDVLRGAFATTTV